jgi:hypothetical protein
LFTVDEHVFIPPKVKSILRLRRKGLQFAMVKIILYCRKTASATTQNLQVVKDFALLMLRG